LALKFNLNTMSGEGLLAKIGVDHDLVAKLLAEGFTITVSQGLITFKNGAKETSYKVDTGLLAKIKAGTLTPPDVLKVGAIKGHLTATMKACIQEGPDPVIFNENGVPATPPPQIFNPGTPVSKTIPLVLEGAFPVSEMKTAKTLPLVFATKLYQPVNGSSKNSRYFVAGISPELRVAVRYQGGSLSVRVEGENWEAHKSLVDDVGLDLSNKGNYASAHMPINDPVLAAKTLGCILAGLSVKGVQFQTPVPSFHVLAGAA